MCEMSIFLQWEWPLKHAELLETILTVYTKILINIYTIPGMLSWEIILMNNQKFSNTKIFITVLFMTTENKNNL
jgi:hypothetical protein